MTSLTDKTALVTGASRGIGRALASALAQAGARVGLAARSAEALHALAAELPNDPVALPADLARSDAALRLAREAEEQLGGIDILVNNAGTLFMCPVDEIVEAQVDELLAVNVRAPLMLVAALKEGMRRRGGGAVINVSSMTANIGISHQHAYSASKGALDAMTRALAAELGPFGIRVNAVAPGSIVTEMAEASGVRQIEPDIVRHVSLGRLGEPDDVSGVVIFLASSAAAYVTGQTVAICGGISNSFHGLPRMDGVVMGARP